MLRRASQVCVISGVALLLAPVLGAAQRRAGDVNGDGRDDLLIGVPYEDLGTYQEGAVHLLMGSAAGLATAGGGFGSQNTPGVPDAGEQDDDFGEALAAGDFNGDGYGDLVVGVPREDLNGVLDAGAVHVFYGSAAGVGLAGNQFWSQDSPGVPGAADGGTFGFGLASGDFNGDGYDDLAVGAPAETVAGMPSSGSITLLYGSASGLTAAGAALFTLLDLAGAAGSYQYLGNVLETGDFDADGRDELAIGVPDAAVNATVYTAGEVFVLIGSAAGLVGPAQLWTQDSPGMADTAETSDHFGNALAAGDFDGDGHEDLAVGVQWEALGYPLLYAGAVNLLYGSAGGLAASAQFWTQDTGAMQETAETYDRFGTSLAAGDFDGDGRDDLAVGVPEESFGGWRSAGIVQVLYGGPGGLTDAGNQLWSQDSAGIAEQAEDRDRFGMALLAGDFDGDGAADLAAAAPQESLNGAPGAGLVQVLYGGPAGLGAAASQLWSQASPGVPDSPEALDGFGAALD